MKQLDTTKQHISVVWLKKDLRLKDHLPLKEAIEAQHPVLLLYIFEPILQNAPDWDIRHWRFIYHSLQALQQQLNSYGAQLTIVYGEAIEIFTKLHQDFQIETVYSHQETGIEVTYQRDLAVKAFFDAQKIKWKEYQCNGVLRGEKNRDNWDSAWIEFMKSPQQHPALQHLSTQDWKKKSDYVLPPLLKKELEAYPSVFQPAGERFAWQYYQSFVNQRVAHYNKHISQPEHARYSCSRLSPYITWGNLSTRQVYQFFEQNLANSRYQFQLKSFRSRLQWRCHFIQKFEMEGRIEFEHINRGFQVLAQEVNPAYLKAWQQGITGFPIVDACMRCVQATGYLNFRMRAMLVSFLTHLLWQPWQRGVHHLAQQFLDYEPGIHYCQFQMQAGVTGINTIRIYNPLKQSLEQDAEGIFIKKWLPELAHLPLDLLHQPEKMTPMEQKMYKCILGEDYPLPIIEFKKAYQHASKQLHQIKKTSKSNQESIRILKKHVKQR